MLGPAVGPWLAVVRQASLLAAAESIQDHPLTSTSERVVSYFQGALGGLIVERVCILYLDAQLRLIRCEEVGRGTTDSAEFHMREVVRRALELGATGLILVHNHPSGCCAPSRQDLAATRALAKAAALFNICVHDHLIVGGGTYASFRALGHL